MIMILKCQFYVSSLDLWRKENFLLCYQFQVWNHDVIQNSSSDQQNWCIVYKFNFQDAEEQNHELWNTDWITPVTKYELEQTRQ